MPDSTSSKRRRVSSSADVKPNIVMRVPEANNANEADDEEKDVKPQGGWNWKIAPLNLKVMTNDEITIYAAFMLVRTRLEHAGIYMKPSTREAAALTTEDQYDFMKWSLKIAGPKDSDWEGGVFNFVVIFSDVKSVPKLQSDPPLFHPNIYPSGTVAYKSILHLGPNGGYNEMMYSPSSPGCGAGRNREDWQWKEGINLAEGIALLLLRVQSGLGRPYNENPAQTEAFFLYRKDYDAYRARIREQTLRFTADR